MKAKMAIAMTAWRRPGYTATVLRKLDGCIGISDCSLVLHVDHGYPDVLSACKDRTFKDISPIIVQSEHHLGLKESFIRAMDHAFELSDYAFWATDDIIPSTDAIMLHNYFACNFASDNNIFSTTAYRDAKRPSSLDRLGDNDKLFAVSHDAQVSTAYIGMWSNRWTELRKRIVGGPRTEGWDHCAYAAHSGRHQLFPVISRCKFLFHDNSLSTNRMPESLYWQYLATVRCSDDIAIKPETVRAWKLMED